MSDTLTSLRIDGAVARLAMNRPDARNALSITLLESLIARVGEVGAASTPPTVLVLTGNGPAFCAGMDLRAVLGDPDAGSTLLALLAELTLRLRRLPMALIAAVNGAAIGGGCGLACVCDFVLTHDDAKLGFPEVDLGVCPAVVAPWVVRRLGAGKARHVLLAGGVMTGREAAEIGLATSSVPTLADLEPAVEELAERLSKAGPLALRETKRLLNALDGSDDDTLVRRGAELSASVLATDDAQSRLRQRFAPKA
ncbi:MAG TPA: enoyl-CoA hydratase/isomerase family protein [Phycisphaerales bacterium]|nr:enoyl-CoA hydratase/isomerase family protein [Phycisphaerales bacterium]